MRTKHTKTFDLGNGKRRLEARIGAIHYKDNYASDEQWRDIDPTLTVQVAASSDDCATDVAADDFSIITTYFWAGYRDATRNKRGAAGRFLNVTIPAGSIITLANLILTCNLDGSATVVNTRLRAEANINPATFSDEANFNARTWTTAFVNWDAIATWTAGVEYTSPDIKACIQEVIGLAGWVSGNPIAILWDDFEQRSTQADSTFRTAYSYDGFSSYAPKLYVEYTLPPGGVKGGSMAAKLVAAGMI